MASMWRLTAEKGNRPLDDPVRRDGADTRAMAVLDRDVAAIAKARAWLVGFVGGRLGEAQERDAVLVLGELVTNALRHGLGEVVVRILLDEADVVHLSVTDSGDDLPVMLPRSPTRIGGLGLHIVEHVSSSWGVADFPGGKTVWAAIDPTQG